MLVDVLFDSLALVSNDGLRMVELLFLDIVDLVDVLFGSWVQDRGISMISEGFVQSTEIPLLFCHTLTVILRYLRIEETLSQNLQFKSFECWVFQVLS